MGLCMSSGGSEELEAHKAVEKMIKDDRNKQQSQVKVLLLGSGDSGKSTILKQMRLIHKVTFTPQEIELYRQLVFNNIVRGMTTLLDALEFFNMQVEADNQQYLSLFESPPDLKDGEAFPMTYFEPLKALWADKHAATAYSRGNEVALPENLTYFFSDLPRFFDPDYKPTDQDILLCRARTIGITETIFKLKSHQLHMVDVGGQKSERRKWIHCFENVTSILFLVSLSGYDASLVEQRDANQMQDAMAIWDSIIHSIWFSKTSIILFLNKDDLFAEKIKHSNIKDVFPDYDGPAGDAAAGREYFRKRFLRLSAKSTRNKEREIYTHFTNAVDTALLRVVLAAVEDIVLRGNLERAALI